VAKQLAILLSGGTVPPELVEAIVSTRRTLRDATIVEGRRRVAYLQRGGSPHPSWKSCIPPSWWLEQLRRSAGRAPLRTPPSWRRARAGRGRPPVRAAKRQSGTDPPDDGGDDPEHDGVDRAPPPPARRAA
jgi:hypothetical protein